MFNFFYRKLLFVIPTLFICSLFIFFIIRLIPGDPVEILLGTRRANPEIKKELIVKLGLDLPLYKQYFIFISRGIKGDLGHSFISNRPVLEEFKKFFPATVELTFFALLFSLIVGIPLGFISALKVNSMVDFICSTLSLVGYSMSVFWWGLVLILFFSVYLGVTPISGRVDVLYEIQTRTGFMLIDSWFIGFDAFKSALMHLILPVLALGTIPLAYIMQITKFSLLQILKEDFIRTAKSKGLGFYRVYCVHSFRNSLISIITVLGLMLGNLLAGAVLTETVFSWPGIGKWLVQAVLARDYPVLQGGILIITFIIVMVNIGVDLLYLIIDPRIRISLNSKNTL